MIEPLKPIAHAFYNPGGTFSMASRIAGGVWERFDPTTGVVEGRCYVRSPNGNHPVLCFRRASEHAMTRDKETIAMAYHVKVKGVSDSDKMRGENVTIEGNVLKIWTEPHEVVAGGPVDPFVGRCIVLEPGDIVDVVRV